MKKCLVLLSGGIDSAVTLWWAKNKGWDLATLSFNFPGRRSREVEAGRNLRRLSGSRNNSDIQLPFIDPPKSVQACYIPKRNLMFYGIAASLAEKIGADYIVGGHFRHDGTVFPDATKRYLEQVNKLVQVPGKSRKSRRVKLLFPFINDTKEKIVRNGFKLKVPFQYTWSCSHNMKRHCWKCNSCNERKNGFGKARVEDPLYDY